MCFIKQVKIKQVAKSNTAATCLSFVEGLEHVIYPPTIICEILKWLAQKPSIEAVINRNLYSSRHSSKSFQDKHFRIDIAAI